MWGKIPRGNTMKLYHQCLCWTAWPVQHDVDFVSLWNGWFHLHWVQGMKVLTVELICSVSHIWCSVPRHLSNNWFQAFQAIENWMFRYTDLWVHMSLFHSGIIVHVPFSCFLSGPLDQRRIFLRIDFGIKKIVWLY